MTYRCAAAFRMMGASLIWNGTICAAEMCSRDVDVDSDRQKKIRRF